MKIRQKRTKCNLQKNITLLNNKDLVSIFHLMINIKIKSIKNMRILKLFILVSTPMEMLLLKMINDFIYKYIDKIFYKCKI